MADYTLDNDVGDMGAPNATNATTTGDSMATDAAAGGLPVLAVVLIVVGVALVAAVVASLVGWRAGRAMSKPGFVHCEALMDDQSAANHESDLACTQEMTTSARASPELSPTPAEPVSPISPALGNSRGLALIRVVDEPEGPPADRAPVRSPSEIQRRLRVTV
eukprot:TRINITY_DN28204_c0_g1_i1.p1 TRINITY_DN28204_c0_g1~~TRINITY_DN28204_c0_g1_i1.p1  ORF type:complete len:163 (+),score=8.77 TRINITY_DN28204_c0_g1_i1:45-533(+)